MVSRQKSRLRCALLLIASFALGGYLFSGVQPRPIVDIARCATNCLSRNELLGLIGSLVVQKAPGLLPDVVFETEKSIVVKHPDPRAPVHLVIVPKIDIMDAKDFSDDTKAYFDDAFAVMAHLIASEGLTKYRIVTNGPGYQQVRYLHFHLQGESSQK